MLRSGQEALDTGAVIGHRVLPIFGLTPEDIRQTNRLVETLLDTLLEGFVLPHTKTTVLQDWIKGRHSEVDDINGLVVAERANAAARRRSMRRWSRSLTASSVATSSLVRESGLAARAYGNEGRTQTWWGYSAQPASAIHSISTFIPELS